MSDEELQDIVRGNLGQTTSFGAGAYIDEINRRRADRQSREMIELTASIKDLTAEIRTLTRLTFGVAVAALVVAVASLINQG